MAEFYTADTHFGHEKIITYCNRPFTSAEEMDEVMIDNWNCIVGKNDTVYHIGDFAFKSRKNIQYYLHRLNGHVVLILGNHDRVGLNSDCGFMHVAHYKYMKINNQRIVMCHFPMRSWYRKNRGSWMLHGHCHGSLETIENSIDVGVDCHEFKPLSFKDVEERINETKK